MFFNHYIEFIESGRMPKKGKRPPVFQIAKWLRRKHIVSSNENIMKVAYAVSYAIWRDGIKGRPVMRTFFNMLDKEWNETYSKQLFEAILHNLTQYFN